MAYSAKTNKLREELIQAKTSAEEERFQRLKYEGKLKDLELKINNICCISKVQENIKVGSNTHVHRRHLPTNLPSHYIS